jgi:hypothetical protein
MPQLEMCGRRSGNASWFAKVLDREIVFAAGETVGRDSLLLRERV